MRLCLTDQAAGWGLLGSTESNLWSIIYVPAWFSCNIRAQPLRPTEGILSLQSC